MEIIGVEQPARALLHAFGGIVYKLVVTNEMLWRYCWFSHY